MTHTGEAVHLLHDAGHMAFTVPFEYARIGHHALTAALVASGHSIAEA